MTGWPPAVMAGIQHRPPHLHVLQLVSAAAHAWFRLLGWVTTWLLGCNVCTGMQCPLHVGAGKLSSSTAHPPVGTGAAATQRITHLQVGDAPMLLGQCLQDLLHVLAWRTPARPEEQHGLHKGNNLYTAGLWAVQPCDLLVLLLSGCSGCEPPTLLHELKANLRSFVEPMVRSAAAMACWVVSMT